ncbi:tripartite tricarboxylate transporter TctB family protein [Sporosarcina sp. HYO08]|uniref:tripartite tricarboxylate transporter TctB family protein n=1 Tax=Sporosarcina sp. HYO08 TaxID=1759557 RepID=UPI00079AD953|nr:tripartite tricarboxylate transporter TctB family protein [Sporosarcina sp. HYO08]KXH87021.1 hypothetical protein AU377_00105 [Sporosarcina sp. HYO08]
MKNIFTLFLLIVACTYLSLALSFPMFSKNIPGSGFLPQIIGVILVLLTAFDLIKNFKSSKEEKVDTTYLKEMIFVIVLCTAYVVLFNIIGAIFSTVLFTVAILFIFNKGKLKQNLTIGISVPIIIFVLFEVLLKTGLPAGIFENIF